MTTIDKNKKSLFRILFELNVNHFNNKKQIKFLKVETFGFCFKYATDPSDKNVEDIFLEEVINKNPNSIIDRVQLYENGIFEMTGEFLCTAKFEGDKYLRSNWKIQDTKTYLLEEEDIQKIA